ncbi:hypothetical protein CO230_09020 [Chryseobacterium sp. 6424]|uniref:hypothetical protein n=1 Tax=Chryseobacterium sp. 6424 TaxID=2039166 RepID=UPI000EFC1CD1|nr:hypothetical protein [Chryseobacterium sp. 6424]AYO58253.1 hypothetical protein CO230_09020 [Chryseobacterium sp. 6424]
MIFTITDTARISLAEIVLFLKNNWTERELNVLRKDIAKFKKSILVGVIQHPSSEFSSNIRYMLIAKRQIKVFYEMKQDEVVVKLFWHCKQNPDRLKNFLKENL